MKKLAMGWMVITLAIMLGGCVAQKDKTDLSSEKQDIVTPEETQLPSEEVIIENVKEMDASFAFELEKVETLKSDDQDYDDWALSGTVFHAFDGPFKKGEQITCYHFCEKGDTAPEPGERFIGSFKKSMEGRYYVEDIGYFFKYHTDLLPMFEKGAKQKKGEK